jgi:hypothetical protein
MSAERIRNIRKRFERRQETWSWSVGGEELSYFAGWSFCHQASGAEHQDPVGDQQDAGIVGGKDHAAVALADFSQGLDHGVRRVVVQLGCGLVGEDDVRIGCEGAGHCYSLLLSERELEQAVFGSVLETEPAEPAFHGRGCGMRVGSGDEEGQVDVLARGQSREEAQGLEYHAELAGSLVR